MIPWLVVAAGLLAYHNSFTHHDLGTALEQAGRVPEAFAHYQQARPINPRFAAARAGLQVAQRTLAKPQERRGSRQR